MCGTEAHKEINGRWYCKAHAPYPQQPDKRDAKIDIYSGLKQPYQDVSMQTHHLRLLIEMLGEKQIPFPFSETEAKQTMQELARAYGMMAFSKDYPEYDRWMELN